MLKKYIIYSGLCVGTELGVLIYDTETREKKVILPVDEFALSEMPEYFKKSTNIVDNDTVNWWISTRIPPPYRHGLNDLLESLGLKKYDEWDLFIAYGGRSSRDRYYIEEIL